jgi:hypothetical protein
MHTYKTNVDQVTRDMQATLATFGFTDRREGRALGELIVDEIIDGIVVRSIDQQCDGNGTKWPVNKPPTWRRKYAQWGEVIINKDTGQMLSVKSLRGTTTITQYLITMNYGTNEAQPDHTQPGAHFFATKGGQITRVENQHAATARHPRISSPAMAEHGYVEVTDVDKAYYANLQGRSFYELDDTICGATFAVFTAALGAHLANPGR